MSFRRWSAGVDAPAQADTAEKPYDEHSPAEAPAVEQPSSPPDAAPPVVEPPNDGVRYELEALPREA